MWGLVRGGGGGLWWGLFGEGGGELFGGISFGREGEWLEIFWESWEGNFDGDYLGEGWRTWGNYLGENFAGRVLGVMKRKEKKKEIGEVELFTKTIPSGVQVNNIILDNTEIINCHKAITAYEQTDG